VRNQRRELHEALLDADSFEDLPGKWQAAILNAEGEPDQDSASYPVTDSVPLEVVAQ
jgi:hypothetical protein